MSKSVAHFNLSKSVAKMNSLMVFTYFISCAWIKSIDCAQWMALPQYSDLMSLKVVNETRMHSSIHCAATCNQTAQCVAFIFAKQEPVNCQLLDTHGLGASSQPSMGARFFTKKMSSDEIDGDGYRMLEYSEGVYMIYKIHTVSTVLNNAESICTSEGAQLIRLTSKAKLTSLQDIINASTEYNSLNGFHVDGNNFGSTNFLDKTQWKFTNGEQMPIELWSPGRPDSDRTCCAWLWTDIGFGLDDWTCGDPAAFICEKPI